MTDYADAFESTPITEGTVECQNLRVAIADGATNSIFAVDWAKMLVKSYVEQPFKNVRDLRERINLLSEDWDRIIHHQPLPWYAEEKAIRGAFSSLLGLEIFSDTSQLVNSGNWDAIAIGDSCLFQVKDKSLKLAFPIEQSKDFSDSPVLISSNRMKNIPCWNNYLVQRGNWQAGDIFFLATDALAAWFIREYELNSLPWDVLIKFIDDSECDKSFESWVNEMRESSLMKNDDVTCLIIKL